MQSLTESGKNGQQSLAPEVALQLSLYSGRDAEMAFILIICCQILLEALRLVLHHHLQLLQLLVMPSAVARLERTRAHPLTCQNFQGQQCAQAGFNVHGAHSPHLWWAV